MGKGADEGCGKEVKMVPALLGWGSDKPLLGLGPKRVCGCVYRSGLMRNQCWEHKGPIYTSSAQSGVEGGVLFEPQSLHRKVQQAARHCPPRVLSTGTVKV